MKLQRRLAAKVMKCSPKRVVFDETKLTEIKEAITMFDIRRLVNKDTIIRIPVKGISKFRTRKAHAQKRKSRRVGQGSRKGSANARADDKTQWIRKIRAQRELLKRMRNNKHITNPTFKMAYGKAKGGFFRSTRHIKLFLQEQELFLKK